MAIDYDALSVLDKMLIAEKAAAKSKKKSKYKVTRTDYDGRTYDSPAEAERAKELDADLKIQWWIPQVRISLGCPENVYVIDFLVAVQSLVAGAYIHAEDVKGFETAKFRKNKKLWKKYGPFPLHVLHVDRNGDTTTEVIDPNASQSRQDG